MRHGLWALWTSTPVAECTVPLPYARLSLLDQPHFPPALSSQNLIGVRGNDRVCVRRMTEMQVVRNIAARQPTIFVNSVIPHCYAARTIVKEYKGVVAIGALRLVPWLCELHRQPTQATNLKLLR